MASAVDDPSTLCANLLAGCAKIRTLLLELKESLQRKEAAVRLQAAVHGFLTQRRAQVLHAERKATLTLPLPATLAKQRLQGPACSCSCTCAMLLEYQSAAIGGSRPPQHLHCLARFSHEGRSAATPACICLGRAGYQGLRIVQPYLGAGHREHASAGHRGG